MKAYAVIETGGKQYRVEQDVTLDVERLPAKEGETVSLRPVLALSDGATLTIGKPHLEAAVTALVVRHKRGKKVVSFKRRRRKGYERKLGHRQELTVLKITGLP